MLPKKGACAPTPIPQPARARLFVQHEKKKPTKPAVADTPRVLPKVIQFDEASGIALSCQEEQSLEKKKTIAPERCPTSRIWVATRSGMVQAHGPIGPEKLVPPGKVGESRVGFATLAPLDDQ